MQVIFESRHPAAAELREVAIERVRFAMRRLTWLVPRARVQLTDTNGPRGGADKLCQIELKTTSGTVVVSSTAKDWRAALDASVQRAARVLVRGMQRQRKPDRSYRMVADA